MILGLTGGIGCGKSTAAKLFEELGFRRIDCDAIVREEVLTAPNIIAAVAGHFGSDVLQAGGRAIDRSNLGRRVFGNADELRWLERLVHPEVHRRWTELVKQAPDLEWVVEIPLLFEKELNKWFDFVVCVACSSPEQLSRLEQRGMNRTLAGQRIAQQLPLDRKIELSDFVLSNDGTPDFLRRQVELIAIRCRQSPLRCSLLYSSN